jgi:hypothetical protein
MAIGLAALGGAALSPLTGLGFGFGYGYGVRLGYHSFKPSKSSQVTGMRLSPNPVTSGTGMGLASAEEMTGKSIADLPIQGATKEPTPSVEPNIPKQEKRFWSGGGDGSLHMTKSEVIARGKKHGLTAREAWKKFAAEEYPFLPAYRDKQRVKGKR